MNSEVSKIESIRTDATITEKSAAYLKACDSFEKEASKFANNESFICRKFAEEVSLSYHKAKMADCEYSVYAAAHACEMYLSEVIKYAR